MGGCLPPRSAIACLMSSLVGPQRLGQFPNDIILKAKVINFIIRIVCWESL